MKFQGILLKGNKDGSDFKVFIRGQDIDFSKSITALGICIDENLTFDNHVGEKFIDSITSYTPSFRMKEDVYQLKYILGLHCPPEAISYCCKYISTIYSLRENDEIQIHGNL